MEKCEKNQWNLVNIVSLFAQQCTLIDGTNTKTQIPFHKQKFKFYLDTAALVTLLYR